MIIALRTAAVLTCGAATALLGGCTPSSHPALTFTPDKLPAAHVGQRYDQQIHIGNARTPVDSVTITSGRLPAGLTLTKLPGDANTAEISGTPTAAGTASFTVQVYCFGTNTTGQSGKRDYTLTVG